jgi:heptose I phosphotransferase
LSFADDAAEALLGGHVAQLSHPEEDRWTTVKQGVSRTVYCGRVGGEELFLKHFHPQSAGQRLARAVGLSDACREMRLSRHLNAHGVAAPRALAAACADGVEWVATVALKNVEAATDWHARQLERGPAGRREVQRAIVALAQLVGRMHAAGVIHRDLHCGNILVRTDTPAPAVVLTDLHRAHKRRTLSRRARAANLAHLLHDRRGHTTRTERLRFLKHYLAASQARGTLRGWQTMVEAFAERHTARQHARRDRKIRGTNQYFTRLRLGRGWRGHAVRSSKRRPAGSSAAELSFSDEDWQAALGEPEALLADASVEVVKDSPSSLVVRRRLKVGADDLDVFIKRRRRKHRWKVVLDCFRHGRSIRAFKLGHALLTRQVATALPLAALERRAGPFLLDSILITEAVKAPKLNEFLDTYLARGARREQRLGHADRRRLARDVLWQMGRLLQRLHDNNFAHRDLKSPNMLVHWRPGSPVEIVLVDLDGLRRVRWLTARQRFQGLMRLNVSLLKSTVVNHAGRLRMLMGYIRRPGSGPVDYKPYWRVLEEWSGRKLAQQIRSRRRRQRAARRPAP